MLSRAINLTNCLTFSQFNCIKVSKFSTIMKNVELLNPPKCVRGITDINSELFRKEIDVPVVHVKNVKLSDVIGVLKRYLLKIDQFKPIKNVSDNEAIIYMNPCLIDIENLPDELQNKFQTVGLDKDNVKMEKIELKYENYTTEQVFRAVLPEDKEGVASFTKVGHIVHINLREHLLPFKKLIGTVLYDKTPGCKTVVNKINIIDNTYRNFKMEILKGEDDMMVTIKENTCIFQFDFSTVYWNSRLSTEHERIVKIIKANDVLFDVFAGVGPFAVPAAKKNCEVYANDLNPESYKWLNHNFKNNKIKNEKFKTYNKDGREFILTEIKNNLPKFLKAHNVHITMNLPALAVEFLGSFVGLLSDYDFNESFIPPTIYLYCFVKGEDCNKLAKDLVISHLGCDKIINIFKVRTVSNFKEMMRVTISLDKDVLTGDFLKKRKINDQDITVSKKCN